MRADAKSRSNTKATTFIELEIIIPLIGTKRRDRLAEALKALELTLSADDLAAVEAAVPAAAVAGDRYAPAQMATLDAERRP